MRSAGIDYAGTSISAFAVMDDGIPVACSVWQPEGKKDSEPTRLLGFERWLHVQFSIWKPDITAVEELAVFLNKNTIRSLGRREGIALVVAKKRCRIVISPPVTQSRGIVFGRGNISKDDAWAMREKIWPGFDFGRKTTGGTDKMDAMTHAEAAPTIAERR